MAGWNAVIDKSYQILAATAGPNGLVPNWCDGSGNRIMGGAFGYDACRTPWRIALDYCQNGEVRAKAYLDRVNAFFTPKRQDQIFDGYTQDGALTGTACNNTACIAGMSFYGPAGVASMAGTYPAFVRQTYVSLVGATGDTYLNTPTIFSYYHASGRAVDAGDERQLLRLHAALTPPRGVSPLTSSPEAVAAGAAKPRLQSLDRSRSCSGASIAFAKLVRQGC